MSGSKLGTGEGLNLATTNGCFPRFEQTAFPPPSKWAYALKTGSYQDANLLRWDQAQFQLYRTSSLDHGTPKAPHQAPHVLLVATSSCGRSEKGPYHDDFRSVESWQACSVHLPAQQSLVEASQAFSIRSALRCM